MVRKTYTPERIINKLREVEVLISQETNATKTSRKVWGNRADQSLLAKRIWW